MNEPMAALDALTREQLYAYIQRISQQKCKTILLVKLSVLRTGSCSCRPTPEGSASNSRFPCRGLATLMLQRSLLTLSASPLILPASLPYLISGMKQGWAFAWRSLMAAEIFVTILSGFGLGHLLHYGRGLNAMEQVTGIIIVIVVIGLLVDKILFAPWERFLHERWGIGFSRA